MSGKMLSKTREKGEGKEEDVGGGKITRKPFDMKKKNEKTKQNKT